MNKKFLIIGIIILVIVIGVVIFTKGDFKQETDEGGEETGEIGEEEIEQLSSGEIGEPEAKWTSEGLRLSGNFVDIEILELPDGSYAMHIPFDKVAYSPDGLTWTMSEDDAIGSGSSIRMLSDGSYRAWWSISKGDEVFDMLTAFSSDGYNWEDETMLTSSNMEDFYGALPAVVISPDGTYRMYYTRTGPETYKLPGKEFGAHVRRIHSAHSSDGLVWESDPGIRIDGAEEIDKGHASSNDVYIRNDGKYEMAYTGGGGREISYAVSNDGLSWTRLGSTGIVGVDPIVTVFSDGTVRMYYVPGPKKDEEGNVILDIVAGVYSAVRESI